MVSLIFYYALIFHLTNGLLVSTSLGRHAFKDCRCIPRKRACSRSVLNAVFISKLRPVCLPQLQLCCDKLASTKVVESSLPESNIFNPNKDLKQSTTEILHDEEMSSSIQTTEVEDSFNLMTDNFHLGSSLNLQNEQTNLHRDLELNERLQEGTVVRNGNNHSSKEKKLHAFTDVPLLESNSDILLQTDSVSSVSMSSTTLEQESFSVVSTLVEQERIQSQQSFFSKKENCSNLKMSEENKNLSFDEIKNSKTETNHKKIVNIEEIKGKQTESSPLTGPTTAMNVFIHKYESTNKVFDNFDYNYMKGNDFTRLEAKMEAVTEAIKNFEDSSQTEESSLIIDHEQSIIKNLFPAISDSVKKETSNRKVHSNEDKILKMEKDKGISIVSTVSNSEAMNPNTLSHNTLPHSENSKAKIPFQGEFVRSSNKFEDFTAVSDKPNDEKFDKFLPFYDNGKLHSKLFTITDNEIPNVGTTSLQNSLITEKDQNYFGKQSPPGKITTENPTERSTATVITSESKYGMAHEETSDINQSKTTLRTNYNELTHTITESTETDQIKPEAYQTQATATHDQPISLSSNVDAIQNFYTKNSQRNADNSEDPFFDHLSTSQSSAEVKVEIDLFSPIEEETRLTEMHQEVSSSGEKLKIMEPTLESIGQVQSEMNSNDLGNTFNISSLESTVVLNTDDPNQNYTSEETSKIIIDSIYIDRIDLGIWDDTTQFSNNEDDRLSRNCTIKNCSKLTTTEVQKDYESPHSKIENSEDSHLNYTTSPIIETLTSQPNSNRDYMESTDKNFPPKEQIGLEPLHISINDSNERELETFPTTSSTTAPEENYGFFQWIFV